MAVNYIGVIQLVLAMVTGSISGMIVVEAIKNLNILCFADDCEEVVLIFYKKELVKNKILVKAIKILRSLVLKLLK